MSKKVLTLLAGAILAVSSSALAFGQTTTTVTQTPTKVTKTVQHPDGTYTVIEYPVKKEVKVMLNPVAIKNAKGVATILRDDAGTRIVLNLTDLPKDVATINLYAVDEAGVVTSLGPVAVTNGVGTFTGTTPLTKFMLVAAPEAELKAYDPNTIVFFRSAVPEGFAVIPHTSSPVGEKVSATATPVTPAETTTTVVPATTTAVVPATTTEVAPAAAVSYEVPMLNIPAYKKGDDTKMKINFSGALTGARANVSITPRKDGPTEVKLRFHELKNAPANKVFTVWAKSADDNFIKLGQIVNTGERNEAEITSEVALADFGLLVTMEDLSSAATSPLGPSLGVFQVIP